MSPPAHPEALPSPGESTDAKRAAYQGRGKDLSSTLDRFASETPEAPSERDCGGKGGALPEVPKDAVDVGKEACLKEPQG